MSSDERQTGTSRTGTLADISSPISKPHHKTNSAKNWPNTGKQRSEILTGTPMKKKLEGSKMKRKAADEKRRFEEGRTRELGLIRSRK